MLKQDAPCPDGFAGRAAICSPGLDERVDESEAVAAVRASPVGRENSGRGSAAVVDFHGERAAVPDEAHFLRTSSVPPGVGDEFGGDEGRICVVRAFAISRCADAEALRHLVDGGAGAAAWDRVASQVDVL
ncbi:hypothetical protein PO587_43610 [Streptomyces gilvifuscus]|uniref:Uncharacterized protein n=1 Tax=Streptomyces gilvifuscus TaxID=1550617 RepID=A0ABT5G8W6_9ACTN|nr:hypothetical protein [Streptomyces gilvifuscus]MDC2961333.1 hypothetical protein [Streptomyces gilvifuscus]